jgi:hypothetical protein
MDTSRDQIVKPAVENSKSWLSDVWCCHMLTSVLAWCSHVMLGLGALSFFVGAWPLALDGLHHVAMIGAFDPDLKDKTGKAIDKKKMYEKLRLVAAHDPAVQAIAFWLVHLMRNWGVFQLSTGLALGYVVLQVPIASRSPAHFIYGFLQLFIGYNEASLNYGLPTDQLAKMEAGSPYFTEVEGQILDPTSDQIDEHIRIIPEHTPDSPTAGVIGARDRTEAGSWGTPQLQQNMGNASARSNVGGLIETSPHSGQTPPKKDNYIAGEASMELVLQPKKEPHVDDLKPMKGTASTMSAMSTMSTMAASSQRSSVASASSVQLSLQSSQRSSSIASAVQLDVGPMPKKRPNVASNCWIHVVLGLLNMGIGACTYWASYK